MLGLRHACLFSLCVSVLIGCASRQEVVRAEADKTNFYSQTNLESLLSMGQQLSDSYLAQADRVATEQDAAAIFNVLLAAGAAFGVVNGLGDDTLARIGIAGLAANQTSSYFDPEASERALITAASRGYCIVGAGHAYATSNKADLRAIGDALTQTRLRLRTELKRTPNNFDDLFQAQNKALEEVVAQVVPTPTLVGELRKCLEEED